MKKENFWSKLKKPIFALAPMADVTDAAFRRMFAKYGKPDVMFTEFVSTEGLCSVGRKNLLREFIYDKSERPIIAQIWGTSPEKFKLSAELIATLGFDGIDINMGCPQSKEVGCGACAALINTPRLAQEIIYATRLGAPDLPVSIKTRIGYNHIQTEEWLGYLLETKPAAVTLHLRTKKEMSSVPAHWDEAAKAVELRNSMNSKTLILGNGDVKSWEDAKEKVRLFGVDGVMIGRATFGNPWFFNTTHSREQVDIAKRLAVMVEHAAVFEKIFKHKKNFAVMRKHFKAYASGFDGAAQLRVQLMACENASEVKKEVKMFLKSYEKTN